jgi:hypothetical protein
MIVVVASPESSDMLYKLTNIPEQEPATHLLLVVYA